MNNMHLATRTKAALSSFTFPYVFIISMFLTYVGIDTIPNDWWTAKDPAGAWDDISIYSIIMAYVLCALGLAISIGFDTSKIDGRRLYRDNLAKSKAAIPQKRIVAELDETSGQIWIHKETNSIVENSRHLLKKFEADEDDAIHQFVAQERDNLKPPDHGQAKAIVKSINEA